MYMFCGSDQEEWGVKKCPQGKPATGIFLDLLDLYDIFEGIEAKKNLIAIT